MSTQQHYFRITGKAKNPIGQTVDRFYLLVRDTPEHAQEIADNYEQYWASKNLNAVAEVRPSSIDEIIARCF